jgi:hypothetical protein
MVTSNGAKRAAICANSSVRPVSPEKKTRRFGV